jgi:hypothetical protein
MRKAILVAVMLAVTLAMAAPASAQTVEMGDLVAGPISESITVAGNPNLAEGPIPELPLGSDAAAAGAAVPPNPFAGSVNLSFDVDFAVSGVGAEEDDVVAGSDFLGNDFVETGSGALSIEFEDGFLD